MEKNLQDCIEQDLFDYIEKLKKNSINEKQLKTVILRIKKSLDSVLDGYKLDLEDGDISKEQLLADYLEQYKKDTSLPPDYQVVLTTLSTDIDACKRILQLAKKNRFKFDILMKQAKQKEHETPGEPLYHSINLNEETLNVLRIALRSAKSIAAEKTKQASGGSISLKQEDILKAVASIKNNVSAQIKEHITPTLLEMACFLDEFGYLDENIAKANTALDKVGLSELKHVKRNPIPDEVYDGNGNKLNIQDNEDLGVIDFLKKENLEKLHPNDLLVLDLCWKMQYFNARLEISQAMSAIEFLDLWPTLLEKDESAIENIDDGLLNVALKRDLALTYLIRNKKLLTPELEKRYTKFLESNGMSQKGTTFEEIENQSKSIEDSFRITDDLLLSGSVVLEKLISGELETKNWGTVDSKIFDDWEESDNDKLLFGIEMPSLRGLLLLSINEKHMTNFLKTKGTNFKRFPKYKGIIDEDYTPITSTLPLPTSTYFKKFVIEKYEQNPTSPLYEQLATNFAGGKKIKRKNHTVVGDEEK